METASLAERAEATGNIPAHIMARSLELRLLAHRGEKAQSDAAERLAERASSTGVPWEIGFGLGAAAQHCSPRADRNVAESLLHELAQVDGCPWDSAATACCPSSCAVRSRRPVRSLRLG